MDNRSMFRSILRRSKEELLPSIQVVPKSALRIHALINFILNIVYPKDRKDDYRKSYTTTLGFTVAMAEWMGDKVSEFGNWETLCHEIDHTLQAKKWTRFLFSYFYLWPISQGIVLLLAGWVGALWTPGWWRLVYLVSWLIVSGIHFIPQWPDPWRKKWEFHAYSISMHLHFLTSGKIEKEYIERLALNFHSMIYFIMEPNKKKILSDLTSLSDLIEAGRSPVKDEPIIKIAEEEYVRHLALNLENHF